VRKGSCDRADVRGDKCARDLVTGCVCEGSTEGASVGQGECARGHTIGWVCEATR